MSLPIITPSDETVTSLHAYSRILGSIRAAQSEPHPRWWHASLQITDAGLDTGNFPLGDGGNGRLLLDPDQGLIVGRGINGPFEVTLAGPASEVGRKVLDALGASIDFNPDRWDAIEAQSVNQTEAASYLAALIAVALQAGNVFAVESTALTDVIRSNGSGSIDLLKEIRGGGSAPHLSPIRSRYLSFQHFELQLHLDKAQIAV